MPACRRVGPLPISARVQDFGRELRRPGNADHSSCSRYACAARHPCRRSFCAQFKPLTSTTALARTGYIEGPVPHSPALRFHSLTLYLPPPGSVRLRLNRLR